MLLTLIAVKLVALLTAFDPLGLQSFELPKAQLSHALAWPLGGTVLVGILRYGPDVLPRTPLHAFVVAYAGVLALSTLFADNLYVAVYGERGNYLGLTFLLDMLILYLACACALQRTRDWMLIGIAILIGLGSAGAYALLQSLRLDPIRWASGPGIPIGTFGSTVRFGHFLSVVTVVGVAIAVLSEGERQRALRAAGIATAVTAFVLAVIVANRAFVVGLLSGLAAGALLVARIRSLRPRPSIRVSIAGLVAAAIGISILVATPLGERIVGRISQFGAEDRLLIYATAVEALKDRPWLGYGPDSFTLAYAPNRVPGTAALGTDVIENSAHNWVLQTAVTTGLLGLLALILLIAAWTRQALLLITRDRSAVLAVVGTAMAAYLGQGLLSVGSVSIDWIPWVALGGTAAMSGSAASHTPPRPLHAGAVAVIVIAAALGMSAVVSSLGANRAALEASRAYAVRDPQPAIISGREAVRQDPGRADHWNWLGLGLTLDARWAEAGDAFGEAAARAPYDATYWQNLARARSLQTLAGDPSGGGADAALDAAHQAIAVEPAQLASYELLAELANSLGRYDVALEAAIASLSFGQGGVSDEVIATAARASAAVVAQSALDQIVRSRDTVPIRLALADAYLRSNDLAKAGEHARRALELDPTNVEAQRIIEATGG